MTRAALYDATHKKKDGSYITEEARINSVSHLFSLLVILIMVYTCESPSSGQSV